MRRAALHHTHAHPQTHAFIILSIYMCMCVNVRIACTILWSRSVCAIRKPTKWSKARKKLENANKKMRKSLKMKRENRKKKTKRALKLKVNELNHQVRQSKNSSELNGCGQAVEELFGVCGTLISQCNDVKAIKYQHAGTYATATTTTTTTTK